MSRKSAAGLKALLKKSKESVEGKSVLFGIDKVLNESEGDIDYDLIEQKAKELAGVARDFKLGKYSDSTPVIILTLELMAQTLLTYEGSGPEVFHPSSMMQTCRRRLFYDLSRTPYSDVANNQVSPGLQKIFDIGTLAHAYVQYLLYKAGYLTKAEVKIVSRKYSISGKGDGEVILNMEEILLEIKTINSFGFARVKKFGPKKEHVEQATVYAKVGGYKKILFLYWNKDTSEIYEKLVEVEEEVWQEAEELMLDVKAHVKDKKEPDRACSRPTVERALNCPYRSKCFRLK